MYRLFQGKANLMQSPVIRVKKTLMVYAGRHDQVGHDSRVPTFETVELESTVDRIREARDRWGRKKYGTVTVLS